MYAYLFDNFLHDRRFQTEVLRIEGRLAELGIQGRSEKMTVLKNLASSAKDMIRRGTETLVVVGNDETIAKVLPIVIESKVTLGILPLGQPNTIAAYLGLPSGPEACDALSRRIVRRLDVGKVENQYFLLQAALTAPAPVRCDNTYTVESLQPTDSLVIANLGTSDPYGQPTDGRLELIVQGHRPGWKLWRREYSAASVFSIKRACVSASSQASLVLDGQTKLKTPVTVEVAPKKLGVIVGRSRRFAG